MTIEQITDLFQWMTIISVGLLVLSSVLAMALKGLMLRTHSRLFGISEDQVAIVSYCYLGAFKVLVIVFNIVPYVSLLLIQ